MKQAQIDRINSFAKFLKENRITTLEVPTLGFWQASTDKPRASAHGKSEWLAVRDLARKLGLIEGEQL